MATSTHTLIPTQRTAPKRFVLVLGENDVKKIDLPDVGTLVVGRDPSANICLDDKAVSRRHAEITATADGAVHVRDLGSQNGTRVRGAKVEGLFPLSSGDLVEIGNTSLFIERAGLARHAEDGHLRFERELQQERARARRVGHATGLFMPVVPGGTLETVRRALPKPFLVAEFAPGHFELLVPGETVEAVEASLAELERALAKQFPGLAVGEAIAPRDGSTPDELMTFARAAVDRRNAEPPPPAAPGPSLSAAMKEVHALVDRIAPADLPVLVTGETGSGKQVVAELIHARSRRAEKRFVRINCAALPENLLEAELFGYERGAFTGAVNAKPGLFEHANGGTLMLDEIGDMPLPMQAKLLQVLEERTVRRLGAVEPRTVDVRLIAATNRDLAVLSQQGSFRADLYWRLNGATVVVPPLRARGDEVLALARQFLKSYAQTFQRGVPKLSPDAVEALATYSWPGNVRQLRNVMERAVLMAVDGVVGAELLPLPATAMPMSPPAGARDRLGPDGVPLPVPTVPPGLRGPHAPEHTAPQALKLPHGASPPSVRDELAAIERQRILSALAQTGNNQTKAAELLGIPRRTFLEKLDKHQIPRPRKGSGER